MPKEIEQKYAAALNNFFAEFLKLKKISINLNR